jgi:hypothetical protein
MPAKEVESHNSTEDDAFSVLKSADIEEKWKRVSPKSPTGRN